jgi:hypothetical protein
MKSWNERIALALTEWMSSMACAYLLLVWALLPLPFPWAISIVSYVSQSVIQLVALSIIMVGTKVSERSIRDQATQDHAMLMEELACIRHMMAEEDEEVQLLREIHKRMAA